MKLEPAVALDDYQGQDQDSLEGRELRQARRANRKARREQREEEKIRSLRQDTRSIRKAQDQGGKRRKGGERQPRERQTPAAPSTPEPRRFPAVPPRPELQRVQPPQGWPAPVEVEPAELPEPEDIPWPEEGDVWPADEPPPEEGFVEEALEGTLTRRPRAVEAGEPGWGPLIAVGDGLRVQARDGQRAAVIPLRPGLYLVAELPEAQVQAEVGVLPILAPLMVRAATRALTQPAPSPAAPALPAPVAPTPHAPTALGWADASDVAEVIGCQRCGRRRP